MRIKVLRKRAKEKGMVLIFAIFIIAAMVIGALALLRSNDTSNMLTSNMLLKDSALFSANNGLEEAINVLNNMSDEELKGNLVANGYYATAQTELDVKNGVDWDGDNSSKVVKAKILDRDSLGNTSSFVIHRMCGTTGSIETAGCMTNIMGLGHDTSTMGGTGLTPLAGTLNVYYRITVRVVGPRGTEGYIQSMMYK